MRHIFEHNIGPSERPPVAKNRKSYYVVVDIDLRNKTLYTTPSKYTVKLDETYKFITSVELVSSCVPTIDIIKIVSGTNDTIVIDGGSGDDLGLGTSGITATLEGGPDGSLGGKGGPQPGITADINGSGGGSGGGGGGIIFIAAKTIINNPEEYFTEEVMKQLDEAAEKEFKYGNVHSEI